MTEQMNGVESNQRGRDYTQQQQHPHTVSTLPVPLLRPLLYPNANGMVYVPNVGFVAIPILAPTMRESVATDNTTVTASSVSSSIDRNHNGSSSSSLSSSNPTDSLPLDDPPRSTPLTPPRGISGRKRKICLPKAADAELDIHDDGVTYSRVKHACEPCRIAKMKCDENSPACANCIMKGTQCWRKDRPESKNKAGRKKPRDNNNNITNAVLDAVYQQAIEEEQMEEEVEETKAASRRKRRVATAAARKANAAAALSAAVAAATTTLPELHHLPYIQQRMNDPPTEDEAERKEEEAAAVMDEEKQIKEEFGIDQRQPIHTPSVATNNSPTIFSATSASSSRVAIAAAIAAAVAVAAKYDSDSEKGGSKMSGLSKDRVGIDGSIGSNGEGGMMHSSDPHTHLLRMFQQLQRM